MNCFFLPETMNTSPNRITGRDYTMSIAIISVLFFIFGFVTWLNSTLIAFLKISCELNNTQAYLVTFAFYISYFVMALPSSWVLRKTGFKGGMALGLLIMAAGSLVFLPAAWTREYSLFLTGLFIQGTGLAVLQTASNPYITIIGPIESAARRISIMGICNKMAGVISPIVLGFIVLKDSDEILVQLGALTNTEEREMLLGLMASRVTIPYIVMAASLAILAFLIRISPLPNIGSEIEDDSLSMAPEQSRSIFSFPHLFLGFVAIFLYVGAEVIAGDTIILYGQHQGFPLDEAKIFTSYTLIAMVVGYILGIALIPNVISQSRALALSSILGGIFSLLAVLLNGTPSVVFIALLGFANAIMWPAIWPLAISNLGKFTKTGSAILIMGIAGGALLPLLYGYLADSPSVGGQNAYWILVPCYLFILYFAVRGYKIRRKPKAQMPNSLTP